MPDAVASYLEEATNPSAKGRSVGTFQLHLVTWPKSFAGFHDNAREDEQMRAITEAAGPPHEICDQRGVLDDEEEASHPRTLLPCVR